MIIILGNYNWFLSTLAQSNAALLGIISAFIINRILNEYERLNDLDKSLNDLFYEVMNLRSSFAPTSIGHALHNFKLSSSKYIGISSRIMMNTDLQVIGKYNECIGLYHKVISKEKRIKLTRTLLFFLLISIFFLVIYPISLICIEGNQSIQLSFNLIDFLSSVTSFQGILTSLAFIVISIGIAFLSKIVTGLDLKNLQDLKLLNDVFDNFVQNQKINKILFDNLKSENPFNS